jgi:outer membrane protein assembly factor BamA
MTPVERSLESDPALNLFQSSLALVGDNTFFGFTSPVQGERFRLEVEPTLGTLNYQNLLVDYRRYLLLRPFTVAGRVFHLGRYGKDGEDDRLTPFFIGYSTLVRGYSSGSFDPAYECTSTDGGDCAEFDRLLGSRILVSNLEIRFPFIGTSQYGLINFPYLPTELSLFLDAGVAWTRDESPEFRFDTETLDRVPVLSAGTSARVNLLNALVLEAYLAFPFQRPEKDSIFGLQIAPGW